MLPWMLKLVSSNIPGCVGSSAACHPVTLAPQSSNPYLNVLPCHSSSLVCVCICDYLLVPAVRHCFLMFFDVFWHLPWVWLLLSLCKCTNAWSDKFYKSWLSFKHLERVPSVLEASQPQTVSLGPVSISLFLVGLVSASCQLTLLSVVELLQTRKGPFSARASTSATRNCTHASGISNHYTGGIKV